MKVFKVQTFQKKDPEVSVILPVFQGDRSPHFLRRLEEIRLQTFQKFEVIVAEGIHPNGRARNEGVKEALGAYLIFLDETTHLEDNRIFEKILAPLQDKLIGISGASGCLFPSMNRLQVQYAESRDVTSKGVCQLTESWQVQHLCMAMRKEVYQQVGWESDRLITGTDNDLRLRVHRSGYKMVLVPDTWVSYEAPNDLNECLRKSYQKGLGAAFAFVFYPGIFELSSRFKIRTSGLALFYKTISTMGKFLSPKYLSRPFILLFEGMILAGFWNGILKWRGSKPDLFREDLRRRFVDEK